MALLPYDPLPPQNQESSSASPASPASPHVSPPFVAHRGQGGQQPVGDKQALLANGKRRRMEESRNAVERRRRDDIIEKTNELATLIPQCMLNVGGEFFFF